MSCRESILLVMCAISVINYVARYMVVVKVGKPTERSKPGNRGKRDSQILLMHYLNRVHFDAPMSPLELEIYHQMRNVIGIDPAFYEYIFTVDADTVSVTSPLGIFECGIDVHGSKSLRIP